MDMEKIVQHRAWIVILIALAATVILLFTFQMGVFVGYRKASFSFRWGDNYHQNFAGPPHGFFNDFEGKGFTDAHGVFGTVLRVEGSAIIIKDKDETEKTVVVSTSTSIRRERDNIQLPSVSAGERIVIIGAPNDQGQIDARFIRVFSN